MTLTTAIYHFDMLKLLPFILLCGCSHHMTAHEFSDQVFACYDQGRIALAYKYEVGGRTIEIRCGDKLNQPFDYLNYSE